MSSTLNKDLQNESPISPKLLSPSKLYISVTLKGRGRERDREREGEREGGRERERERGIAGG